MKILDKGSVVQVAPQAARNMLHCTHLDINTPRALHFILRASVKYFGKYLLVPQGIGYSLGDRF